MARLTDKLADESRRPRRPTQLTDLVVSDASLVDRPANPQARVLLWKSADRRPVWKVDANDRGDADPIKAGDEGRGSGTEEADEENDVSMLFDPDAEEWFLVDGDGKRVGGPYADKEACQAVLAMGSSVEKRLDRLARARQTAVNKAADSGQPITYAKAYSMVLAENPDLYEQYKLSRAV